MIKKNGKVFTSKFVGTGPSSYKKSIYRAAVSQRLRNTALEHPDRFWDLPNVLYSGYRGAASSRRIKWPKHEAISDLQSSNVVKNVWSLPPFPFRPYVALVTVHRGCVVRYISRILTILDERVCFKADYSFFRSSKLSPQSQAWVVIRWNISCVALSAANNVEISCSIPIRPGHYGRQSFLFLATDFGCRSALSYAGASLSPWRQ